MFLFNYLINFISNSFLNLKIKKFNKNIIIIFFYLFLTIFFLNFFGSLPYNFPLTSQLRIVFFLSIILWITINSFYIINSFKSFISHNVPEGTPYFIIFFLFVVEIISNLIRPITLSLRLIGNIVAGHIFLNLIFSLIYNLGNRFFMLYLFYISVEILIRFLQAYIIITLIVMYYADL